MSKLTSEQLKHYEDKGFVAPLDALTQDEAEEVKSEIEFIEKIFHDFLLIISIVFFLAHLSIL